VAESSRQCCRGQTSVLAQLRWRKLQLLSLMLRCVVHQLCRQCVTAKMTGVVL